jgi:hypothetical protein
MADRDHCLFTPSDLAAAVPDCSQLAVLLSRATKSESGLLTGLTFIGGTCLRACYGSARLSKDLDFIGGHGFMQAMVNHWIASFKRS